MRVNIHKCESTKYKEKAREEPLSLEMWEEDSPCHCGITFSPKEKFLTNGKKLERRVECEPSPVQDITVHHPLHGHTDSGCSGPLPMSAAFQARGRCKYSARNAPISS